MRCAVPILAGLALFACGAEPLPESESPSAAWRSAIAHSEATLFASEYAKSSREPSA